MFKQDDSPDTWCAVLAANGVPSDEAAGDPLVVRHVGAQFDAAGLNIVCSDDGTVPTRELLASLEKRGAVLWLAGEPSGPRFASAMQECAVRLSGLQTESQATWWQQLMHRSDDKYGKLNEARLYLESKNNTGHRVLHAIDVADELITNAFYDAPVDAQHHRTNSHMHRSEKVTLPESKPILFGVSAEGKKLAIRVTDKFGSLEMGAVAEYLDKRSADKRATIDAKQGGAGLGLLRIVESADEVWVRVHPGQETVVEARWDWSVSGPSRKRRAEFTMLSHGFLR